MYGAVPRIIPGVEIVEQKRHELSWTCSHQLTNDLLLDTSAPVFRLVYAATEADYRAGKTESLILPGSMRAFFEGPPNGKALELGHVSRFGHPIANQRRIFAGVQALFADRSATPLPAAPVLIDVP